AEARRLDPRAEDDQRQRRGGLRQRDERVRRRERERERREEDDGRDLAAQAVRERVTKRSPTEGRAHDATPVRTRTASGFGAARPLGARRSQRNGARSEVAQPSGARARPPSRNACPAIWAGGGDASVRSNRASASSASLSERRSRTTMGAGAPARRRCASR